MAEELYEVTIYFKSGNKLVANFVNFETYKNGFGALAEVQYTTPPGFGVQYLDLNQIECITARPLVVPDAR